MFIELTEKMGPLLVFLVDLALRVESVNKESSE